MKLQGNLLKKVLLKAKHKKERKNCWNEEIEGDIKERNKLNS